jgi:hypothetical protein
MLIDDEPHGIIMLAKFKERRERACRGNQWNRWMSACLDKNNMGAFFSKRDGLRLANSS